MYFFKEVTIVVINNCIRERGASDIVPAKLGVPLTIELIYLKAPLFLVFKSIEDCFKVSAVRAVRGEVFDKFEAGSIVGNFLDEFFIADEV